MIKVLGIIASSLQKGYTAFTDTFTRTTSGSLGTSSSGGVWKAISGVWFSNGTKAQSDTVASAPYPIAAAEMATPNVTASVSTTPGTGVVFWLSDAGNWWGAVATSGINYAAYYDYVAASYTPAVYGGTIYYIYGSFYSNSTYLITAAYYSPAYSTGPYYYQYATHTLQIIKSVGSTITSVASTSLSSAAAAVKVITNNLTITARAYSNTAMTTQLGGDLVNTPVSAIRGTNAGIIKYSSSNQGSTVDDVNITSS